MLILFILIISFSFFTHSLLGFGGGLIAIPLLSIFMPVQDVVSMVMVYQFSMGLLIFKTYRDIHWPAIFKMVPSMVVGAVLGIMLLNILPSDVMRGILAGYIILHLARKYTRFDPLKLLIKWGEVHLAGFLGGLLNTMMGSGAPAFILYLKEQTPEARAFRASIIAILMASNIPRAIGTVSTGLLSWDLFMYSLYSFPAFLIALYLGQKFHDKVPQKHFFLAVEVLLALAAVLLIGKIVL